jgi:hypothetical protein
VPRWKFLLLLPAGVLIGTLSSLFARDFLRLSLHGVPGLLVDGGILLILSVLFYGAVRPWLYKRPPPPT